MTGPAPEHLSLANPLIQEIQEYQAEYLVTHVDAEKQELREVIAELKENLQGWQANANEFVWQVEFPEVFQEGGFDIVIGNPPYVRQELIRSIKPILKRLFSEVYAGTADLYVYFYKRGTELLRAGGSLIYISSNSFLRAGFSRKLRKFFTDKVYFHRLLDFGSVPVFKAGVDTCIFLCESKAPDGETFFAATFRDKADIPRLPEAFRERAFLMNVCDLSPNGWTLTSSEMFRLLERLENVGTRLERCIDGGFYRGLTIGCNDAFIIDESVRQHLIFEHASSDELIKPSLRGRTLKKWKVESTNEYMIVIASSVNREWPWSDARSDAEAERIFAENYPAIHQHLNSYRERLIAREDRGKFYWELRSCTYYAGFAEPKIIYPQTAKSLYACYDTAETFGVNSIYFIPTSDLSLLAVLNSRLFDWYARHKFQSINDPWAGGRLQFLAQYIQYVPIADRTAAQKAELADLVKRILVDPQSDGVREIEQEIDELVYQLYGLTDAEIELIKQTYRDAGMEV